MLTSRRKRTAQAACVVVALLFTGACGGGDDVKRPAGEGTARGGGVSLNEYGGAQLALGQPKKGGELKLGMIGTVSSLDPVTALSTPALSAAAGIYGTLAKVAPDGSVVPDLAASIESTDHQHWTITLRDGLTFTDGTPYDARAVVSHIERYTAPEGGARDAAQARQITAAKARDDRTVELELAKPNVDLPYLFTAGLGEVPSPTAVKKDPKALGLHPVGAGPFKVESFQPDGDLVLVRNPDYYDSGLPYLDKLTMVTAADSQSRLSAIQAGTLDLASTTVADDFDKAERAGLTVLEQPLFTYYYLTLNLSKPPFDDPAMRKAMFQAIDTAALDKAVFAGKAKPMKGWFVENHPDYVPVDRPAYDQQAAKAAVDAYRAKGGSTTLEIQLTPSPENQRATALIQQMLKDVGIEVTLTTLDQPTSILKGLHGDYTAIYRFIGFTLGAVNDLNVRLGSDSSGTITHAGDPALDAIIEKLQTTPYGQRHDLYAQAQEELARWMPMVPLVQQAGAWIVGDRVGGFPGTHGETTADQVDVEAIWAK